MSGAACAPSPDGYGTERCFGQRFRFNARLLRGIFRSVIDRVDVRTAIPPRKEDSASSPCYPAVLRARSLLKTATRVRDMMCGALSKV